MENRVGRWLIRSIYAVGALFTGILFLIYILRCDMVLFPDAMLPMRLYEQASVWLAWGAVPMGIASALLYRQIGVAADGRRNWKALCVLVPALVCACFFVYWIGVWIYAIAGYVLG